MSNTYFKFSKSQVDKGIKPEQVRTSNMELSLTAYVGGSPNCLQLTVLTHVEEINRFDAGYISLTQEEQDKLICGILERRGIYPAAVQLFLEQVPKDTGGISATSYEQSTICPAE